VVVVVVVLVESILPAAESAIVLEAADEAESTIVLLVESVLVDSSEVFFDPHATADVSASARAINLIEFFIFYIVF
jgi:hypothetical protein